MSARITDAQRTAAVYAVHARLRRETIHGDSITSNAGQIAHIAVDALAAKGWTPPPTRRPAHGVAELAAEVRRLRAAVDAVLALHPFRFADVDDPERNLGDPALWLSEVEAALAGVKKDGA